MKFKVMTSNLLPAVTDAARAVSKRTTLPVLEGILLRAGGGFVELTSTDLEWMLRLQVPAKVESEGAIVLPAKILLQIVKGAPKDGLIEFDLDGATASIKAGAVTRRVTGIDEEEYPSAAGQIKNAKRFTIHANELARAINRTVWASASDQVRPILTGVSLRSTPLGIEFAAADNYKMAIAEVEEPSRPDDLELVIPGKSLSELARLLKPVKDAVGFMSFDHDQVRFELPDLAFTSRLIQGMFPNYQQVIPVDNDGQTVIRFDRDEALYLTKAAGHPDADLVKLYIGEGLLTMRAKEDRDEFDGSIETLTQIGSTHIGMRTEQLLPTLSAHPSGIIEGRFNGPLTPAVFRPEGEPGTTFVVMPVNVKEGF